MVEVQAHPRRTSPPIWPPIYTLISIPLVNALRNLGGNVTRLRRVVFLRDLVRTRFGRGAVLPLSSPLELLLRVFLLERDVECRLQNFSHMLLSVDDAYYFCEPLEFVLEFLVRGKPKIENLRTRGLQKGRRALRGLHGRKFWCR